MPYLSRLLHMKVKDSGDRVVGRLEDILISPKVGEYAPLEYLVVKARQSPAVMVPYEYVGTLSREEISLKSLFANIPTQPADGEHLIHLMRDVLDQQIVDVAGARVVRVNDLRIGIFEGRMSVLGIDVSQKGLLRRLGLEQFDFLNVLKVHLIDWRQTQPVKGFLRLNVVSKDLKRLHPADLANIIEELSLKQGSRLVRSLDAKAAAKVLEEVNPRLQKILVKYLGPEQVSKILAQMSVDEMVDLMRTLSPEEANLFLRQLQEVTAQKVASLIQYPNDTAGGLMTLDFVTARPEWTVAQTIAELRRVSPTLRNVLYVYVTHGDGTFGGAVSLRWLLLSPPEKKMQELVKTHPRTSTLRVGQKVNRIVETMTKYNLFMAAVLDPHRRLVGVVAIDDIMRRLAPHA